MAKMYPQEISKDTKSDAEWLLFDQFREKLPDEFSVFHHVSLLGRRSRMYDKHGEIDFVIVHPALGVLVLEVKGGLISVEDGCWFSTDKGGVKHKIDRSPFDQVEDNKFDLIREIKADQRTEKYQGFYRIRHGVAMPDSIVKGQNFGMNAPREIIIDANDLWDLPAAVRRVMGTPEKGHTIPKDALIALKDLLKPTRESAWGLSAEILLANGEIIKLTEQQYSLLDYLRCRRRALVSGCAGSGKTMLAMEKARRLAAEGKRVLFTCYNVNLGDWVREQFAQDPDPLVQTIDAWNYDKLAYRLCGKAGRKLPSLPPDGEERRRHFAEVVPTELQEALRTLPDRFDAIIVDEGQDFNDLHWVTLSDLLSNTDNGIFYIFYDDNQRIYQSRLNFPFNDHPFPLTINRRNTDRIHEQVVRYHKGTPKPRASGLEEMKGRPPEFIPLGNEGLIGALRNVLRDLLSKGIPADLVVILTPIRKDSTLKEGKPIGNNLKLTWEKQPSANKLRVSTIQGFKGLESPIVILAELDRIVDKSKQDELLYVATSRAQSHLIVLGELPEPVTQPVPGQTQPDLAGAGLSDDAEVDVVVAAEPTVPPTPDDVITPVIAPEVAAESVAVSEAVEVVSPSSSDVIADPVARVEADAAISVAAAPTGEPEAGSSSTEPCLSPPSPSIERVPIRRRRLAAGVESRPSPPSPRIGRGGQGVRANGDERRIPAPLALPEPTNSASPSQELVDRAVPARPKAPPQPVPSTPRPSWTGQVDDQRQWSMPPVERAQPRASTPAPTSTPPSSGVGGARKSPKAEGGKSAPPEPPRKGSTLPAEPSGNGWAVAGLLCGILALFIHILAIAAIVAAAIGLSKTREHGGRGKAAGWIGLALGVIILMGMLQ